MKRFTAPLWALVLLIVAQSLWVHEAQAAATLLPNGKQQFFDGSGTPLAGGSVAFYIPNTSTPKSTWQDAGQVTLNTNPVILDGSGQALIYGLGTYRQVVKDSLGNTIWDQLTNEPAAAVDVQSGAIVFGGTSTGAANTYSITVSPPVSAYIAGQRFQFVAHQTNSGPATLNVSGTGAANIYAISGSGPVALTGGEIVLGNVVDVLYDGTEFQLLAQPPVSVNSVQTGTVLPYAGNSGVAPSGYLFTFGQCVSRTTFAALFAVIGTTYGVCDGSTTYGIPDIRGNVIAGADAMGGTPANRLGGGATGGITGSAVAGAMGGEQEHTQTIAEMPPHTHSYTAPNIGGGGGSGGNPSPGSTSATTGSTGGGNPMNITQPTLVMYFIIKY